MRTPVNPSVRIPVNPSVRTPVNPSVRTPVNPSARTPVNPSVRIPVNPSFRTPVNPSVRTPVNPSVRTPVNPSLTEHLFEPNRRRRRGQDLVSLNIQRGRDHALQPYVRYREEFGLEPVTDFAHPAICQATNLKRVYRSVEDIDLFVGGLSEPPNMGGGQLGDTFSFILAEQMKRLKFGDRFFFTHDEPVGFTDPKVMCLTVELITEMQLDAFVERGPNNPTVPCDDLVGDLARDFLDLRDFVVEP
ncbi:hypothetical protein ACOMHN_030915 [Nucella lapillus]